MANVHTPERQPNESQAQYRERQARSRAIVKTMRKGPTQAPAINKLDVSRFFLGQHKNPVRNVPRRALRLRKFANAQWLSHWQPQVRARKHKQYAHPLRDAHGAYTLAGRHPAYRLLDLTELPHMGRRVWLAGISAQRGY
jgi:hypothetical protein